MSRIGAALNDIARAVGLEGAFLLGGTLLLAIGASYLTPAGPWFVSGAVALVVGIALAFPRSR